MNSPSRFTGRGRGMGPYLQIHNYMDISKDSIRKQNLSRNEIPRPGLRGGGRGGVPKKGRKFTINQQLKPVIGHFI